VTTISSDQLARDLAIRDLTDPAAGGHAIQLLIDLAVAALTAAWDCHVYLARGPGLFPWPTTTTPSASRPTL
jgi:phenylalanyl-tRNA synthetase alpha chain